MLIAAAAVIARALPTPRTIDDAFITFRYARNLLDGLGFVYNAGERVLGTTTPLYTLLMAGLGLVGARDFPWTALWVNALADAVTCVLLARLGQRLSGRALPGLAVAALWALSPTSVTFAIGGMETSLFILLVTLSAALYLEDHPRAAAVTAGLVLLTRPDGILFVGPLIVAVLIDRWRTRRALPWAEAAAFVLTGLPWALFATWYFGSPIPNSVAAKTASYRLDPLSAFVGLIQHYSTPFFESAWLGVGWQLLGLFVYFFLCLLGAALVARREPRAWPIVVYPWLYFAVFAAANPLLFRWYLAPPLPFYFLLIFTGLAQLGGSLAALAARWRRRPLAPAWGSATVGLAGAALLATSLAAWTLRPDHGPQRPAPQMAWHALELIYTDIGRRLAPQVTPHTTVIAAGDIGALGYYSNARILDTVGLISPETTAYFPLDPALYTMVYAVPPQLIVDRQPDYTVFLENYGRQGLFRDPRFLARYTLLEKVPTDIYGSDGMLVYARQTP